MKRLNDREEAAWVGFLRAQRSVLDKLEAELRAEHNLSLSEFEVLLHLYNAPLNSLRMKDLAANVLVTPSGLTRLADRMVNQALIAREVCPSDRRGYFLVLTAEGRERYLAAAPTHLRGVSDHFVRHLGPDAEAVAAALARVASH
jgi:DNA-binding MarR family transcriptional regulator